MGFSHSFFVPNFPILLHHIHVSIRVICVHLCPFDNLHGEWVRLRFGGYSPWVIENVIWLHHQPELEVAFWEKHP